MSPAITTDYPMLLAISDGARRRMVHVFTFTFVVLLLVIHLAMILLTGPLRQVRRIILGN